MFKKVVKKTLRGKLSKKRGAEVIENILMMGIAVSLIVAIFYPQLSNLMSVTFANLENWFTSAINGLIH